MAGGEQQEKQPVSAGAFIEGGSVEVFWGSTKGGFPFSFSLSLSLSLSFRHIALSPLFVLLRVCPSPGRLGGSPISSHGCLELESGGGPCQWIKGRT